jgi:hypothetical protein
MRRCHEALGLEYDPEGRQSDRTRKSAADQRKRCKSGNAVEVPGVEPGSSVTSAGLLRAQPVRESQDAATHRRLRHPQPRCDVPPGREARPDGKSLKMTLAFRPSGYAGANARPLGREREVILGSCLCLPALSRRSGDVGSLHLPRYTKSKPRTPLSSVRSCAWPNEPQCTRRVVRLETASRH